MRAGVVLSLFLTITAGPAFAGATVEQEGPLSPCVQTPDSASTDSSAAPAQPWGIQIATALSKEEALAEFSRVKQDHADILGSYDPIIVAQCDLHLGTKLQYSVRIGAASREDADALCAKLRASGGACIVQKN
jgi:sporulation related protein